MGNSVYGLFCLRSAGPGCPEAVKFLGLVVDDAEVDVGEAHDPVAAFGLGDADGFARRGGVEQAGRIYRSRNLAPG